MKEASSVRRYLVGAALRQHRLNAGLAVEDAARILDCDKSKISRLETGERGIRTADLRMLLTEYGAPDDEQDVLASIAWQGRGLGVWAEYRDVLPGPLQDYLVLEATADGITTYQAQQVPPLLQTRGYARAAIAAIGEVPDNLNDDAVEALIARQRNILTERESPVGFLISESALRQLVGSSQTMRVQLERLAHLAVSDPHVTIRVIPRRTAAHPGINLGPTTLLRFPHAPGLGVVHLAGPGGGTLLYDPALVTAYDATLGRATVWALSPPESAHLIEGIIPK